MRLHVVGLPTSNLTADFCWCAFTMETIRFAKMMTDAGVEVITYGNGLTADVAGKYVSIDDTIYPDHFISDFDPDDWVFKHFNNAAIAAIYEHLGGRDIICILGGTGQKPIADALPHVPTVEYGIGYTGVFSKHRVYKSHTWEALILGPGDHDRAANDAVITSYHDPAEFMVGKKGGYAAFIGRVSHTKGIETAVAACKEAGVPLKIAGHVFEDAEWVKDLKGDAEYIGEPTLKQRKTFLGRANWVLTPSRYVEPFCAVHVEAMFSGAIPITPDFGVFTETVIQGVNGWRCRTIDDYVEALRTPVSMSPRQLRNHAISRWSPEVIAPLYLDYFDRIT